MAPTLDINYLISWGWVDTCKNFQVWDIALLSSGCCQGDIHTYCPAFRERSGGGGGERATMKTFHSAEQFFQHSSVPIIFRDLFPLTDGFASVRCSLIFAPSFILWNLFIVWSRALCFQFLPVSAGEKTRGQVYSNFNKFLFTAPQYGYVTRTRL